MRLFWKIFLSVITVTTIIICISGHLLIGIFFRESLANEADLAIRYNRSLCRSFETAAVKLYGTAELGRAETKRIFEAVDASFMQEMVQITIFGKSGKRIYVMTGEVPGRGEELLDQVGRSEVAYRIQNVNGKQYLCAAEVAVIGDNEYVLQSVSEVTPVYAQKTQLYRVFAGCMAALIAVTAAVTAILSAWITLPIRKLSQAVQAVGQGNYSKKIKNRGQDEIGDLSREFNRMTGLLEEKVKELQDAADRQEKFVGSFAHEMKTPLTSIIGYSEMMRSQPMTEEQRMIYSDCIYQQGKRLEKLSRKMLDLIVLKKTDFDMRRLSLGKLLRSIRGELAPVLAKRQITMKIQVRQIWILAEPDLLKTVFLNFFDNSMKALEEGGEIVVSAEENEGEITVRVSDNGKGIPEKDVSHVTESFYMADKSRKYQNGSVGLGLSICSEILQLHHASMEIASREGQGTTITVIFRRMP